MFLQTHRGWKFGAVDLRKFSVNRKRERENKRERSSNRDLSDDPEGSGWRKWYWEKHNPRPLLLLISPPYPPPNPRDCAWFTQWGNSCQVSHFKAFRPHGWGVGGGGLGVITKARPPYISSPVAHFTCLGFPHLGCLSPHLPAPWPAPNPARLILDSPIYLEVQISTWLWNLSAMNSLSHPSLACPCFAVPSLALTTPSDLTPLWSLDRTVVF